MAASNWAFVTASYVITWVVILGYLLHVHRAVQHARAEYDRATGHGPEAGGAA
ncbi:MAG: CcmD family protein [Gemmatimonadaceae bacterium]